MDEIRLAFRRLLKRPAVTLAAVTTLAVGIGAAAAAWSLLSAVLLRPLPVREPGRLVLVGQSEPRRQAGTLVNAFIYPFFPHIRDSGVFEHVAAQWSSPQSLLVNRAGVVAPAAVGFASHDLFEVLGVPIMLGRGFAPDDDKRGAAPVAVLTHRYWRRAFGADPALIGRTILVSGKVVSIVGVAARGFRGLDLSQAPDLYLPFHTIADVGSPTINYFAEPNMGFSPTAGTMMIARLRPDESVAQVAVRLSSLAPPPGIQRVKRDSASRIWWTLRFRLVRDPECRNLCACWASRSVCCF